jgi:Glycosyltransferase family 87
VNVIVRSWSASTDPWRVVYAALGLFLLSFTLLHFGFYQRRLILDTVTYHRYGIAMAHGQVPYRDFSVEYPPGALATFVLPAVDRPGFSRYNREFQLLMGLCAAGALLAMARALRALRAPPPRLAGALGFFALAPLALGSVVMYRYDFWPAALAVGGLAGILAGRNRLGFGALGLGLATKIFPGVMIPPAVAYVWRTRGRREALVCLACAAAVVALVAVPFLSLSPDGFWSSIRSQASRPLQIESLGSAILLAAHHLGDLHLTVVTSHGSQNLDGSLPTTLGAVETVLLALSLLGIWAAAARGPASPERLVRYSAASVTAFVAFDKVLSPQFMVWLLPLVPLVRGRRGLAASALLGLALVLTQLWFPIRYSDLTKEFAALPSWLVLARDLTMLVLLAVLLVREREPVAARS